MYLNLKTKTLELIPDTFDFETKSITYAKLSNFVTTDTCEILNKYADNNLSPSFGLGRYNQTILTRQSLVDFINVDQLPQFTTEVVTKITEINNQYFKYDLTHLARFQYTTYNEGGFLDYHNDDHFDYIKETDKDLIGRKLSISILLSDPEEYEGGEFEIQAPKGTLNEPYDIVKLKPNKGDAILFPSFQLHKVYPITKGTRKSLVVWFFGPKWT